LYQQANGGQAAAEKTKAASKQVEKKIAKSVPESSDSSLSSVQSDDGSILNYLITYV